MFCDDWSLEDLPRRPEIISFALGALRSVAREKFRQPQRPSGEDEGVGDLLQLLVRVCPTDLEHLRAQEIEAMDDLRLPVEEVASRRFLVEQIEWAFAVAGAGHGAAGHA